jgi:alpha-2-macroglobulin
MGYGKRSTRSYAPVRLVVLLMLLLSTLSPYGVRAAEPPTPTSTGPGPGPAEPGLRQNDGTVVYLPIIRRTDRARSQTPQPVVIQQSPARGEEFSPDETIELVFDRPMNRQAVQKAFSLVEVGPVQEPDPPDGGGGDGDTGAPDPRDTPDPALSLNTTAAQTQPAAAVAGRFTWADERTLHFQPDAALNRSASYEVVLGEQARARDGKSLGDGYRSRFVTAGFLEVGQVIPADGTPDAAVDSDITVIFNRPVVPLKVVEEQDNLPQPLRFEPAVTGSGEWLNTSIYVFRPDKPLQHRTSYTATVADTLVDIHDNPMTGPYQWSFTTTQPPEVQVVSVSPWDARDQVPIEEVVTVTFDQPVDAASARAAFHLRSGGNEVPGAMLVTDQTLVYTPAQRLGFNQQYELTLDAGLQSGVGGRPLPTDYRSTFQTVPLPRIVSTTPADGETSDNPYSPFVIYFSAPIDPDTVMPNITIEPTPDEEDIETYYSQHNNAFHIYFGALPSSAYTIAIGPNIRDPYGNSTGQSRTVRFRTPGLDPVVYLATPGQIATYSAYNPTRIGLQSANIPQASLSLYRLQQQHLFDYYGREVPNDAQRLRQWGAPLNTPQDRLTYSQVPVDAQGGALEPGIYLVELEQTEAWRNSTHTLVVSTINLTLKAGERDALVWASDLENGEPLPNITIDFYDQQQQRLGSATTDSEGIAAITFDRTENTGVVAIARQPFAAVSSNWPSGTSAWDFGVPGTNNLDEMTAHIYTDRAIYRPDQTVAFKGVLRNEDDVRFSLPAGVGSVDVAIYDPTREEVYRKTLPLNANGTFDGVLELDTNAALGDYSIQVMAAERSFSAWFTVAAYRAPEFEVTVTPQQEEIVRGTATQATVQVDYFFGAPVKDAPVNWAVQASPYYFSPDWARRYQFGSYDDPWMCWDCWWMPPEPAQPILRGSGTTDAQGRLIINLPATLTDSEGNPLEKSMRLTIEASVTGKDNQVVSNSSDMVVHAGDFYIGLATQTYLARAGEAQTIDLLTVDTREKAAPSQDVKAEVYKFTWENTYLEDEGVWEWEEKRTLIYSQTVTTDSQGQARITFTPAEGGSYRVVATGSDTRQHTIESSIFLWVSGSQYVSWRRENHDRITLITDRTSYQAGETAEIFIPSPFQGSHWALITIERGTVLSHEVIEMEGNSTVYEVPITAEHVPNIYVSVVLINPPVPRTGKPPLPTDYKVGLLPLEVSPDPQTLQVTLTPDTEQGEPGQTVTYDVLVEDNAGNPVQAELSLDLVDKAVLTLKPRTPEAIVNAFYSTRPLAIATTSGLSISADRLQPEEQQPPEKEEDAVPDAPEAAPMPPEATPAPGQVPRDTVGDDAGKGGGGNAANAPAVREEFADTAYWNATVTTNAEGQASIQVKLPDNLTTWVMRGVGLTAETHVGEGTSDLVATKPLLIRPVTPRFMVVGDQMQLAANVSNRTDGPLDAEVVLHTNVLSMTTPATRTLTIPANSEATATWRVGVPDVAYADLVFQVTAGDYGDASKPRLSTGPEGTLPVYRYSAPEVVGTAGQLPQAGARTEVIALPPRLDTDQGELSVQLDPSLAASMQTSLDYLEHFEYECTEQTVSRFLPNVVTWRALKNLGIDNRELEQKLPALVEEGLNKLYSRQHSDGGWGWWVDDESNPYVSAYVVFGMVRAQEAGFSVREDVLNRGVDFLRMALDNETDITTTRGTNKQAWLLYVLAEAGYSDPARADTVYEYRDTLSSYARAYLALVLHHDNPQDERIQTLLSDLNNSAILSATGAHWEESQYDWWSMNTDTRSTAIMLYTLSRLDPDNALNPNVVRWLMVARQGDAWETTQETSWSILALTDWMQHTGELNPDYDYSVWLDKAGEQGSDPLLRGHIGKQDVMESVKTKVAIADLVQEAGNWLTIGRGEGSGNLYYTAHLRAFLPVEAITALDRGVIVRRRYTLASCTDGPECPEVTQVRVGDIVRVEVSIVAPNNLHYVVVEDPLPAGAEAIDSNLATTGNTDQSPQLRYDDDPWYWWWWRWYSRSELRDEKVVLFSDYLSKGSYLYTYTMRATLPGEFRVIPTTASEFYFPEVYGRGDGMVLHVVQ